ncbi:hypothetical protein [Mesorhizobium sp. B2-4-12]|uniref:hypothetical protein n=1 Tax=Mesorhizobium sp. B2-4-12 TaxID=2589937 RepID=UPI0015E351D8|nr:hypothetical protein [Mesorhizobium sp. B2-4-12]
MRFLFQSRQGTCSARDTASDGTVEGDDQDFDTALLVLLALASPSHAATLSMKRGLNLDLWVPWPGEGQ